MVDRSEVALLGGFVFSVGGDAVPAISAGSQRLLAFLAGRDRAVSRLHAAATLWPESSAERAGASLRSALSRLEAQVRHAVTATPLDLFLAKGVVVDVVEARSLARRLIDGDALPSEDDVGATAVRALSQDLLPGWYDDWVVLAAEDWRQTRMHALEAVACRLTESGRLAEAAAAALAAVRAEPLRESARAALIRVHVAQGNQAEALREFERYRALLDAELGLEPTPRLRRVLSGPGSH